jgi:hypothetical protein
MLSFKERILDPKAEEGTAGARKGLMLSSIIYTPKQPLLEQQHRIKLGVCNTHS